MGAFGALNGRKVYPSFCSNSRYYFTVYKDKIPCPVFNIDNPWINIFLPVCQSQKCQRRSGRHPRAGSLSLIKRHASLAPDAGLAGGEPPQSPHAAPTLPAARDHRRGVQGNVSPSHNPITDSTPACCSIISPHQVGCGSSLGPKEIWVIKILRKGLGGKSVGMRRAAALLRSACGSSRIAEMWCDTRSPFAEYFQHRFAHSITQSRMLTRSCPQSPLKLRCGEIHVMLQNISGSCVHLPLELGETEVSLQDLWKPRPLKSTADGFQSLFC